VWRLADERRHGDLAGWGRGADRRPGRPGRGARGGSASIRGGRSLTPSRVGEAAEDRAARHARELADTREQLHAAERDTAHEAERREQVGLELDQARTRARALTDAQQRAAATAADGRLAALTEERDALRAELRDLRKAAESDRREAQGRLEQLTAQAISAAPPLQ
jgi:hypothetical protein